MKILIWGTGPFIFPQGNLVILLYMHHSYYYMGETIMHQSILHYERTKVAPRGWNTEDTFLFSEKIIGSFGPFLNILSKEYAVYNSRCLLFPENSGSLVYSYFRRFPSEIQGEWLSCINFCAPLLFLSHTSSGRRVFEDYKRVLFISGGSRPAVSVL